MRTWRRIIALPLALPVVILTSTASMPQENMRARGKQLFTEQGCYGCHVIDKYGTPIAPELSRVGAKYDRAYLTRWLRDPSSQKPTAHMPKIALTDAEVQALAAYLASLR